MKICTYSVHLAQDYMSFYTAYIGIARALYNSSSNQFLSTFSNATFTSRVAIHQAV